MTKGRHVSSTTTMQISTNQRDSITTGSEMKEKRKNTTPAKIPLLPWTMGKAHSWCKHQAAPHHFWT